MCDIQHERHSITTLSHYGVFIQAECRVLFIIMLNVIMQCVIVLNVVAPKKHSRLFDQSINGGKKFHGIDNRGPIYKSLDVCN
jgi:hypothetical protein